MQRTGILGVKMMETERKKAAKEIVVAIDHGLSFPETVGLERPIDLLRELVSLLKVDGLSRPRECTVRQNATGLIWNGSTA